MERRQRARDRTLLRSSPFYTEVVAATPTIEYMVSGRSIPCTNPVALLSNAL